MESFYGYSHVLLVSSPQCLSVHYSATDFVDDIKQGVSHPFAPIQIF